MAAVCEKERHFIKRFFKFSLQDSIFILGSWISYTTYTCTCARFFISSGSLPFACYRSSTPSNTFERVDYRNFERRQFLFLPFPRNFFYEHSKLYRCRIRLNANNFVNVERASRCNYIIVAQYCYHCEFIVVLLCSYY